MTLLDDELDITKVGMQWNREPRRKVHGLRFPVIPTGAWLAQVGGAVATLSGVFMLAGAAVTLIVAGVASVTLGALREAGKV